MKAVRIREYGKPLVLEDIPIPDIRPEEALVQVRACGMCRSDVQLVDGYFRKYAEIPTPIIPGHEITGVVHKLGSLVHPSLALRAGDHVVVAPGWRSPRRARSGMRSRRSRSNRSTNTLNSCAPGRSSDGPS